MEMDRISSYILASLELITWYPLICTLLVRFFLRFPRSHGNLGSFSLWRAWNAGTAMFLPEKFWRDTEYSQRHAPYFYYKIIDHLGNVVRDYKDSKGVPVSQQGIANVQV